MLNINIKFITAVISNLQSRIKPAVKIRRKFKKDIYIFFFASRADEGFIELKANASAFWLKGTCFRDVKK